MERPFVTDIVLNSTIFDDKIISMNVYGNVYTKLIIK